MTNALYDDLRDAVRAVCMQLDPLPHDSAPLGVAWHPWARAFLAGLYSRKATTRALEAARPEALLDGATNAVAVLSRAAASAAATAVLNALDGDAARAQEVARETRAIADLLASQLKTPPSTASMAISLPTFGVAGRADRSLEQPEGMMTAAVKDSVPAKA